MCAHFIHAQSTLYRTPSAPADSANSADSANFSSLPTTTTNDQLLLYLVQKQGRELHEAEQAAYLKRLETDTTTAFPFHVGFGDSIRIAAYADSMWQSNPMLMPLLYEPLYDDDELQMPAMQPAGVCDNMSYNSRPNSFSPLSTLPDLPIVRAGRTKDSQLSTKRYIATYHPELFAGVYQPDMLSDLRQGLLEAEPVPIRHIKALVPDPEEDKLDRIRAIRQRYSYWYKEATVMLQLSQNYVTRNWYQGGNSNFAVLGILQGKIIYNNRRNITWENTGEWRFGFNTVSADTLRKINTNDDVFKLYSKFGLKIVEKLSFSVSADFQTHFFHTWKENTETLKTGPFTPARLNLSVGLDYKPVKDLSLLFSPLTYRMVGVADTVHVKQTTFSVPAGQKVLNEAGSSFRAEWVYKPFREVNIDTKFYLYTNYSRVEIDLEIAADFIINRFLSARVLLHPRYDNTVILPDDERAKLQFKEFISVGFSHKFR